MTTVPPNGLQIVDTQASRRSTRSRSSARVAELAAMRGVTMNLELVLLMAVVAALIGAVLPT
ncbi:MAG TPA: hypothetical protein VMH36_07615 [Alphaproteobacteria bacterium]|nr:hypothetical protein [Alphaproteobacteria bacterium]